MRRPHIPEALRRAVAEEAQYSCGYCQTAQEYCGMQFHVEHITPIQSAGLLSSPISGWPVPCATVTKAHELTASTRLAAKRSRSSIPAHKLGSNISLGARTACLFMVELRLGERRSKPSNSTTNMSSPRANIGCVSGGIRPANDKSRFAI